MRQYEKKRSNHWIFTESPRKRESDSAKDRGEGDLDLGEVDVDGDDWIR